MNIKYDPEADAVYIRLNEKKFVDISVWRSHLVNAY